MENKNQTYASSGDTTVTDLLNILTPCITCGHNTTVQDPMLPVTCVNPGPLEKTTTFATSIGYAVLAISLPLHIRTHPGPPPPRENLLRSSRSSLLHRASVDMQCEQDAIWALISSGPIDCLSAAWDFHADHLSIWIFTLSAALSPILPQELLAKAAE